MVRWKYLHIIYTRANRKHKSLQHKPIHIHTRTISESTLITGIMPVISLCFIQCRASISNKLWTVIGRSVEQMYIWFWMGRYRKYNICGWLHYISLLYRMLNHKTLITFYWFGSHSCLISNATQKKNYHIFAIDSTQIICLGIVYGFHHIYTLWFVNGLLRLVNAEWKKIFIVFSYGRKDKIFRKSFSLRAQNLWIL